MAQYKTPLPRAFGKVTEFAINQVLKLDPQSAEQVSKMQGQLIALELQKIEITLFLRPAKDRLEVRLESNIEPDATISGSPMALLNLAKPDMLPDSFDTGKVKMSGDVDVAKQMDNMLKKIDPDWEEAFCQVFGDIIGHQLYRAFSTLINKTNKTASNFKEDLGHYLTADEGHVAHSIELEDFADAVDDVRDGVERLAVRVKKLSV